MNTGPGLRVVFLYAALLASLFIGLSLRTIRMRRRLRIAVGDRGNEPLLRAMRVHANFAEYVPFGLVLLLLLALAGATPLSLHALGATLLAGRASHAYGVARVQENYRFRVVGMALTFGVLASAAVRLLVAAIASPAGGA